MGEEGEPVRGPESYKRTTVTDILQNGEPAANPFQGKTRRDLSESPFLVVCWLAASFQVQVSHAGISSQPRH